MTNTTDRVTRVAADLMDSAAAEGVRQSRSAKQQLDHWARVGRAVSSQQSAARRRVEAALTGIWNCANSASKRARCSTPRSPRPFKRNWRDRITGTLLAEHGITTVALDENGDIVEHRPDGSSVLLTAKRRAPRRRKDSAAPTR